MVNIIHRNAGDPSSNLGGPTTHFLQMIKKGGEDIMVAKKLTRFEKARIIGARALQLSMGAVPQVDISKLDSIDPIDIAMLELKKNKMPLDVKRRTV